MFSNNKSDSQIIFEAIIVGVLLIIIYSMICLGFDKEIKNTDIIFLSGSLFHILCESTGLNEWYVQNYYN